jgi:hypothetical protein
MERKTLFQRPEFERGSSRRPGLAVRLVKRTKDVKIGMWLERRKVAGPGKASSNLVQEWLVRSKVQLLICYGTYTVVLKDERAFHDDGQGMGGRRYLRRLRDQLEGRVVFQHYDRIALLVVRTGAGMTPLRHSQREGPGRWRTEGDAACGP